jgi:Sec-independent protein translocase protein TatA
MNLFGVGNMEMLFVLIVALLVLGPSRMVDVARQTGHWWREAQRVLRGMADAATVRLDDSPAASTAAGEPASEPEDAVARGSVDEPVDDDSADSAGPSAEAGRDA